jgi:hypothetical protein
MQPATQEELEYEKRRAARRRSAETAITRYLDKLATPNPDKDIRVPNPDLYTRSEGGDFMKLVGGAPPCDEGWKLHVPMPDGEVLNPAYALVIWRGKRGQRIPIEQYEEQEGDMLTCVNTYPNYYNVFVFLQQKQIFHKYVRTVGLMRQMDQDKTQKGKFLTIYPDGEEEMLTVITQIDLCLAAMDDDRCFASAKQHAAPCEKAVGSRKLVSTRYGAWTNNFIQKSKAELGDQPDLGDPSSYTPDDRKQVKPAHIRDPFTKGSKGEDGWHKYPF